MIAIDAKAGLRLTPSEFNDGPLRQSVSPELASDSG
jgi:hypothetical protein